MQIFDKAAEQVRLALSAKNTSRRLVQLGDLGGYNHKPGASKLRCSHVPSDDAIFKEVFKTRSCPKLALHMEEA